MTSAPRSSRFLLPLLLTAALLAGCGSDDGDGDDGRTKEPTPSPSTTTSGSPVVLPAPTLLRDVPGIMTFDSSPHPDWVTLAGQTAFVANAGAGLEAYSLTGQFRGTVQTGTDICLEPAAAATGPLWVVDCRQGLLLRVVPGNGNIKARIQLAGTTPAAQSSLAVGPGSVYLIDSKTNEIVRIDPKKNAVAGRFAAPEGASSLAFGFGSLWVSSEATGVVSRLDPATGTEQASVELAPGVRAMAVGPDAVWVVNDAKGTLHRVAAADSTVGSPIAVASQPIDRGDVTVDGTAVVVRVSDALIARVDAGTNQVVTRYGGPAGSGGVAAAGGQVWVSAAEQQAIWRIPLG